MDIKMVLSNKIGLVELYNFDVHQIYILYWHQYENLL